MEEIKPFTRLKDLRAFVRERFDASIKVSKTPLDTGRKVVTANNEKFYIRAYWTSCDSKGNYVIAPSCWNLFITKLTTPKRLEQKERKWQIS